MVSAILGAEDEAMRKMQHSPSGARIPEEGHRWWYKHRSYSSKWWSVLGRNWIRARVGGVVVAKEDLSEVAGIETWVTRRQPGKVLGKTKQRVQRLRGRCQPGQCGWSVGKTTAPSLELRLLWGLGPWHCWVLWSWLRSFNVTYRMPLEGESVFFPSQTTTLRPEHAGTLPQVCTSESLFFFF